MGYHQQSEASTTIREWLDRPFMRVMLTVLAVVGALVLMTRGSTPASQSGARLTTWNPTAQPSPVPIQGVFRATGPTIDVWLDNGVYASQREDVTQAMLAAMTYTSGRFGTVPRQPIKAEFVQEPGCGLHGLAYTDIRTIQVFTCDALPPERAVSIMAHEIVHQLAQDRYGARHMQADLILSEGVATWGAGTYWLGQYPDFRSFAAEQRRNGAYYPLATHYEGLGMGAMNTLYYEWASFVEFLLETYGRDKFDQLYVTGSNAPGSADYRGVYGRDLAQLEQEWLRWLDGQ